MGIMLNFIDNLGEHEFTMFLLVIVLLLFVLSSNEH